MDPAAAHTHTHTKHDCKARCDSHSLTHSLHSHPPIMTIPPSSLASRSISIAPTISEAKDTSDTVNHTLYSLSLSLSHTLTHSLTYPNITPNLQKQSKKKSEIRNRKQPKKNITLITLEKKSVHVARNSQQTDTEHRAQQQRDMAA